MKMLLPQTALRAQWQYGEFVHTSNEKERARLGASLQRFLFSHGP